MMSSKYPSFSMKKEVKVQRTERKRSSFTQLTFMMKLYGVLVLFLAFSVALGLRCYTCLSTEPKSCTGTTDCSEIFDRCFSLKVEVLNTALITKGCQHSAACIPPIKCCEGNLCNGAVPTGPGVILLLLSSALMMLFI
ncbi:lymphocyte antigen 6G-like [Xiphophorus hellerii]|uniref:lymphocyte antigen 6G-like n=1 Tax=Xiphophorus hellerii TaxID=8084 RepID=UPI0013B46757|nr:lymphocyte antigen 6G-like [Xiphophorus hellerii]